MDGSKHRDSIVAAISSSVVENAADVDCRILCRVFGFVGLSEFASFEEDALSSGIGEVNSAS